MKSRDEKSQGREEKNKEDQKRENLRRKMIQVREKVGKSRNTVFFSGGSKSRLAKAAGAEPAGQMRDEKLRAVVARSTFLSQNVQNTPTADHFWKLTCRKSARRCGAKHISNSKCAKHTMLRPPLEVEMSKKCMPSWCETHLEVKMYKTHHVRTTFGSWDVEKVHAFVARSTFEIKMYKTHHVRTTFGSWDDEKVHAVVARSTFGSQNVQNTPCSDHFWKLRWWKSARRCGVKHKTHQVRTTFGSCDVEQVHAIVARSTFRSQKCKALTGSEYFWTFRCRFAWQAQGIMHLVKSEQNRRVLQHFHKRWQAWDIWRGSAKMHFPWQAQYKRHVHQSC